MMTTIKLALFGSGDTLKSVAGQAGVATPEAADTPQIIGKIIGAAISFVGVILLGYLLYGGFTWMTAGGDNKKVEDAKTMIRNAVIGLVIVATSYAIAQFVLGQLAGVFTPGGVTK